MSNSQFFKRRSIVFLLIGLLIGTIPSALFVAAQSGTPTTYTITGGQAPGAPDYTIFVDGSYYYYKDKLGVISTSYTNASALFNTVSAAASTAKGTVVVKGGTYIFNNCTWIYSNTYWQLEPSAILRRGTLKPNATTSDQKNWCIFYGENVENVTVDGGQFDGTWGGGSNWNNLKGSITATVANILFYSAKFVTVKNAEVYNHPEQGIFFYGGNAVTVDSCRVYDIGWNGISLQGSNTEGGDCYYSTMSNNILWGAIGDIALDATGGNYPLNHLSIVNNRVLNMTGTLGSSGAVQYAVRLEGAHNVIVSGNILQGKVGVMDFTGYPGNNTVTDNQIMVQYDASTCYGIYMYTAGNLIQGNTIMPTPADSAQQVPCLRLDGGNNRVIGNSFTCGTGFIQVYDYSTNYYLLNDFSQSGIVNFYNGTHQAPRTASMVQHNIGV